uniref:Protein kinase domain-containing protein n=1 Tax=Leptocylindrus danicus TaxID=163516 RepID=A0A7S2P623_9STRA|mmetsp:Transcript_23276/g.34951  ORF Transcript_23276/g.34951 Transcript_23276/m.34951 type:complete len:428 (+) Transcript_23276:161-1444(+)|eukprot:CAMPEP_0116018324 /NCGR_PEP_ID=MMETSP0321-20121206/8579_1 /TAXON_ID=163516 /ORGANISM="Leptocylindrus danicus var. danicus, Strain B650" /LENGTH=427 /DNA_ID=CAMNT_0003488693 /DNA_START=160 /DNA_END=1443 /DNA_ORIENTATION=-
MSFFDTHPPNQLPKFKAKELTKGEILGVGEFGVVHQIKSIQLVYGEGDGSKQKLNGRSSKLSTDGEVDTRSRTSSSSTLSSLAAELEEEAGHPDRISPSEGTMPDVEQEAEYVEEEARERIERRHLRRGKARYAIKTLRAGTIMKYRQGGWDLDALAVEARFLAVVEHPNIIKMRGTSDLDPMDSKFFIILDRLYGTLREKMNDEWLDLMKNSKKKLFRRDDADKEAKRNSCWLERLIAAYDLSSALRYLHSHQIIYRDLKPENIGFDVRGDVKLFDFGLAKELLDSDHVGDGLYSLEKSPVGSRRYMAPEVALVQPYNAKADVYSFGILLWEICSLEIPFDGYSVEKHSKLVVNKNQRPKIKKGWPKCATMIMQRCWSPDIFSRPDISQIAELLKREADMFAGNNENLLDRSQHMMNLSNKSMGIN